MGLRYLLFYTPLFSASVCATLNKMPPVLLLCLVMEYLLSFWIYVKCLIRFIEENSFEALLWCLRLRQQK
jgi:hypothetical protein